jgi:hypothetical protein
MIEMNRTSSGRVTSDGRGAEAAAARWAFPVVVMCPTLRTDRPSGKVRFRACGERDQLDRWIAEGFYYTSWFVRDWTSHPNFPRPDPEQYHNDCIRRIADLADWFFQGSHNYIEPHHWPDL